MHKPTFHNIRVHFGIYDGDNGVRVHHGNYRLADDTERRAFGQRCHDAINAGHIVVTSRNRFDIPPEFPQQ